ncbi:MAG: hypothetical protein EOM17_03915, partial [Synergistales bacterium]|nr:hypothetical protein [Synergistales bacterium]
MKEQGADNEAGYILLKSEDSVVVLPEGGRVGQVLSGTGIVLKEDIPAGHKAAAKSIRKGTDVIKYGFA